MYSYSHPHPPTHSHTLTLITHTLTPLCTFPEVALGLPSHLAHDLWSVDEKEEGTSFVGHGSSNQGLASARGTIQEDTTRGLGGGEGGVNYYS